ncbi:MAG: lysophospholipid acyltransferase family protein [Puniceicoccales bacterium]|jgi:lysophospholipid acyltransferase (LPLAT)-like uncharacterized protein|nr:lysophospholipid acyltransferase family protein [Puniceicoccales bacterium]
MSLSVNWLSPLKQCFAKIITFLIRIWTKTLRIEISEGDLALLKQYHKTPKICALWHNRLFVASELFKRHFQGTKMYGLISPSRDGAWLTEIYKNMGICAVRGSTKRGGKAALLEMTGLLNEGHTIAITPDGPRGPKYNVKPGIAALAKETNTPIILGGIKIHSAWRFRSWDQFYLPKPFSSITVKLRIIYPETYAAQTCEELLTHIQNILYRINSKTQKQCCFV